MLLNLLLFALIGVGILFILGGGVALLTGGNRQVGDRLEQYVGSTVALPAEQIPEGDYEPELADRLDDVFADRGLFAGVKQRIARADVRLRVSEYFALQVICAILIAFVVYFLLGQNLILAIVGLLVGPIIPLIYINVLAGRRLRAFESQLSDTLNLWVNALRSGYSVLQGMEAIATEQPEPISKEFERVVQEVRLGLSLNQALFNMLRRVPSEDLDLIVTAVNIQREVGGNLTEILDTISYTIRERIRIKGEIRTLTAQGRMTGIIISLLPIGLAILLNIMNPDYGGQLLARESPFVLGIPCGWLVLIAGGIMMLTGILIIRRIVDIEV